VRNMDDPAAEAVNAKSIVRILAEGMAQGTNVEVSADGEGEVDNSAELHRYYVRTCKKLDCVAEIAETYEVNGVDFCAVTREISVAEMHELAKEVRKEDAGAFFAGIHTEV